MTVELSLAEARRIALAAQGLAEPRPAGRVDRRHLRRALDRMGLVQIDAVNVVARSQDLVLFSRLGPHPRTLIDDAVARGDLFECWSHEASLVPTAQLPLHRWRMDAPFPWPGFRRRVEAMGPLLDEVYRRVAEEGPVTAADLEERTGPRGEWWDHSDAKTALTALFHSGRIAARRRPRDLARVYDLPERILPAEALARPALSEHDARKELLVIAARCHGVATLKDLADYHHLTPTLSKAPLAELVEEGRLLPATVEGWDRPALLHPEARRPRRVEARALLSPFDPVVWTRERALRLFGFHYRIEIYTPAAERVHGYYVLPFLLGDELVGRVDLKADRAGGALRVQSAWVEPGAAPAEVAAALADELRLMATWLALARVEVTDRGDLAPTLRRVLR
jgi:uncharacterized protein YcaQ